MRETRALESYALPEQAAVHDCWRLLLSIQDWHNKIPASCTTVSQRVPVWAVNLMLW
jgi:hypothetical protein